MADAEEDPFAEKPQPKEVWEAAEDESFDDLRESVEARLDLNIPNPITLNTPLLIAIKNRDSAMAKYLLLRNADVRMQNSVGDTALHWAALRGDEELVKLILKKEVDLNAIGECSNTPLHLACSKNCEGVAKLLVLARRYGNTPYLMTTDATIRQMLKTVMDKGEAGREQVKDAEEKRLALEKQAKAEEHKRQKEAEMKKREQDAYDWKRREEILAEERRIEEEEEARIRAEAEELQRQEQARIEAEQLELERVKAEKAKKKGKKKK